MKQKCTIFWKSLAFSMIQQMLVIWLLVPLPFLNPLWASANSRFTYCWTLAWRILSITLLACEMIVVVWTFFGIAFLGIGMKQERYPNHGKSSPSNVRIWAPFLAPKCKNLTTGRWGLKTAGFENQWGFYLWVGRRICRKQTPLLKNMYKNTFTRNTSTERTVWESLGQS